LWFSPFEIGPYLIVSRAAEAAPPPHGKREILGRLRLPKPFHYALYERKNEE